MRRMPALEMPNVYGKAVERITLFDDPLSGRELTIRFMDQTELSVTVGFRQTAMVRHFDVGTNRILFECDEMTL